MWTFSTSSRESPVCSANVITGTSPAYDTRCSSSNTADPAAKLCDHLHRQCLSELGCCSVRTTVIPEGTFLIPPLNQRQFIGGLRLSRSQLCRSSRRIGERLPSDVQSVILARSGLAP